MALYEIGSTSGTPSSTVPYFDIAAGSGVGFCLRELGLFNTTATATDVALNRPTVVGTRSAPAAMLALNGAEPTANTTVTAGWSVNPTLAALNLRRAQIGAAIGAGVIWTWGPNELYVPANGSLCIVLPSGTGQVLRFYVKVEE